MFSLRLLRLLYMLLNSEFLYFIQLHAFMLHRGAHILNFFTCFLFALFMLLLYIMSVLYMSFICTYPISVPSVSVLRIF